MNGARVMDLMKVRDGGDFGENRVDADRVMELKMIEVMGTMVLRVRKTMVIIKLLCPVGQ